MFRRMCRWKIMKIGQYLARIWTKVCSLLFLAHRDRAHSTQRFYLDGSICASTFWLADQSSSNLSRRTQERLQPINHHTVFRFSISYPLWRYSWSTSKDVFLPSQILGVRAPIKFVPKLSCLPRGTSHGKVSSGYSSWPESYWSENAES